MRRFYYERDNQRVEFYLGSPSKETRNVLYFQNKHMMNTQNTSFPNELMNALDDLLLFSRKYKIRLDQLCAYILNEEIN